jgi:23S rRNA (uracil1939-C5)-methyltransferase
MISMNPKKVIYISCNPETLERDLAYIVKRGYEAKIAIPVDMFPGTEHVESIILMTYCGSKKK